MAQWVFWCRQLLSVRCPRAFDAVAELDLDCVFEGDEVAEVFDLSCWQEELGVDPLNCHRVVFLDL